MKYPEVSVAPEAVPPVNGIIEVFGGWEVGDRANARSWSESLGRVCVQFARGNPKQAQAMLKKSRRTHDHIPPHRAVSEVLQFRKNVPRLRHEQKALHATTVDLLKEGIQSYQDAANEGQRGGVIGRTAEQTTIALLGRYAHPDIVVLPALKHMDTGEGRGGNNFDVCLAVNDGGEPKGYMLQVKKQCSGRCGDGRSSVRKYFYNPPVQFVSGHCDLGLGAEAGAMDLTVPTMLVSEFAGEATAEEVKALDVLSDHLLFNITADLLPRGTARLRSLSA